MQCLKTESNQRYGTVMLVPPQDIREQIIEYSKNTIIDGLIEIENKPHVTILHGILTNDINEVKAALGEFHPIRVMFGKTNMWMASDDCDYDIVKIDVYGVYLNRLRKQLMQSLENEQTHSTYWPHLTLAAVKSGFGIDFIGNNPWIGQKIVVDELLFSPAEGEKGIIKCNEMQKASKV